MPRIPIKNENRFCPFLLLYLELNSTTYFLGLTNFLYALMLMYKWLLLTYSLQVIKSIDVF